MIFYHINNDVDKLNHYMQKLEHFNFDSTSGIQVYEADFVKVMLDEIISKPEENVKILGKLKDILSRAPRGLFVETYHDKISKILE
jgi:hypothetical protein